ncbi:NDP-hexose 2,3-dehydratase family protein [Pseudonocardia sp. NPDC046786]|uniref:NDP-hexose 2,3-dehydratase family protein n=1 Tax=Pseudonocardia sp. NPDC046786 TaxID=3155471 RepID=UPI0033C8D48B
MNAPRATAAGTPTLVPVTDRLTPIRIAESSLCRDGSYDLDRFRSWFADHARVAGNQVERVPLEQLDGWSAEAGTGTIRHDSGRFFSVEGVHVQVEDGPVPGWEQPIINQPEVGILGILATEIGGVLHFLMQAKAEPGNVNGLQLAPTVQATRSNYTRVHRGRAVPYLDYFRDRSLARVLVDVRQSEQGAWFLQKRNRNMVVEVVGEVPVVEGFHWMTLGQIQQLLRVDDLVNMDARTVLSCLHLAAGTATGRVALPGFPAALIRSCDGSAGALHATESLLSWVTEKRSEAAVTVTPRPLAALDGWDRADGRIEHASGRFFAVVGVAVQARGREVVQWSQPMIEPRGEGLVALLVRSIGGVLHALVHARIEPGYVDAVELAPTVQCIPDNYAVLPAEARPPHLDEVLAAPADRIRFAATFSEEGGRFLHARSRYLVVETDLDPMLVGPDYRWMTAAQIVDLLRHSHYFNVQARTLVACLHSLVAEAMG